MLLEDIAKSKKLLVQADKTLDAALVFIQGQDIDGTIKEYVKYESICEKIVNLSRLMPMSTGSININEDIMNVIESENNVDVNIIENGWFYVKIPSILPKKESGNPSYIRTTLYYSLRKFFFNNTVEKFTEKCTIIFKHNYSKERPYREYRDHDNIEINAVVDLIALFILKDDNPLRLDHYYFSTSQNDVDNTEIFVVPTKDIGLFLDSKHFKGGM